MKARFRPVYGSVPVEVALARAIELVGRVRFDPDDGTWGFEAPEWLEGGETDDPRWIPCGSQRQGFALRREYLARHAFRTLRGEDFGRAWELPEARKSPEALLYRMLREHVRTNDARVNAPGAAP